LWFVAEEGTPRIEEIVRDPNVNLSYVRERTKEWVSVSGAARICRDRSMIRELYDPAWKAWFPAEGGVRDGGPEDPRIVLIGVEARSAWVVKLNRSTPVFLFGPPGLIRADRPASRSERAGATAFGTRPTAIAGPGGERSEPTLS